MFARARGSVSAKVSKGSARTETGQRGGVPGVQWAAAALCRRRCRRPEPLARRWALGECSVERAAPTEASTGVAGPRGMQLTSSALPV
jgi:hypothetical protein